MKARFLLVLSAIAAAHVLPAFAADADAKLAHAIASDDRAAVKTLLAAKADVNASLVDGTTPLILAVRADELDMVNALLQQGASVNAHNRYGLTALHLASSTGNAAIVQRLLKAGADPNSVDASGETMLILAARSGSTDAVKVLVETGAAINVRDTATAQTALMWAVRSGHTAAADLLIAHGADVNARTRVGPVPPMRPQNVGGGSHGLGIIRGGWPERGAREATPGGMTPLLYAARDGQFDIARALLAAKADINLGEADGVTPLLMSIMNDHMDVATLLVNSGADVNASDWFGRAPLWASVEIRNRDNTRTNEHDVDRPAILDVTKLLLEHHADVNARTKEIPPIRRWVTPLSDLSWVNLIGMTPFLRAALSGDITVMRLLLAHGADPQIATVGGTTALAVASGVDWVVQQTFTESKESLMQAVLLCLEQGIDVNAANETGVTAAMGAANRGSDDILEVLIKAGARLDVADAQGRTLMRWAQGEFLALHPPEAKPSTIALLKKYTNQP